LGFGNKINRYKNKNIYKRRRMWKVLSSNEVKGGGCGKLKMVIQTIKNNLKISLSPNFVGQNEYL